MDQKKNQGQQSEGFPGQQQGSQQHTGQQNWNEPKTPNPNREPAEGPRKDTPGQRPGQPAPQGSPEFEHDREKGAGTEGERNQDEGNRDLDSEMEEQEELPERGSSQSER